MSGTLFPLGTVVTTRGIEERFRDDVSTLLSLLRRHLAGDWGDLDAHDREANRAALRDGARILSAYNGADHPRIWIITEADRSSTCILFPDEY